MLKDLKVLQEGMTQPLVRGGVFGDVLEQSAEMLRGPVVSALLQHRLSGVAKERRDVGPAAQYPRQVG